MTYIAVDSESVRQKAKAAPDGYLEEVMACVKGRDKDGSFLIRRRDYGRLQLKYSKVRAGRADMAVSVVKAATKVARRAIKKQQIKVPDGVFQERWATCKVCTNFNGKNRCELCGCFLKAKLRLVTEKCPAGKWKAHAKAEIQGPVELATFFDRVLVVSLRRREDRLTQFFEGLETAGWPFSKPEVFYGVDGRRLKVPAWWKQGRGAWGCRCSHMRIIEDAMQDGVERLLILEDDAMLLNGFAKEAASFLEHVPADWDQIYLGGQHLAPKKNQGENAEVIRPHDVNRTHAYALRDKFMGPVYRWLNSDLWAKHPRWHIDHMYGRLHRTKKHNIYAPRGKWLVGQRAGKSDILNRQFGDRFFIRKLWKNRPVILVVGPHRAGTSLVAGIVYDLGAFMGWKLLRHDRPNKRSGAFEAATITRICEQAYPFPSMERKASVGGTIDALSRWFKWGQDKARQRNTQFAAKYPHFCVMHDELLEAAERAGLEQPFKIVSADRPFDDVVTSLTTRGKRSPDRKGTEKLIQWMLDEREKWFDGTHEICRVNFNELLDNPVDVVESVAAFVDMDVDPLKIAKAVLHVDPERVKNRGSHAS